MLCALLLGLFLMHGSPASAAGCHRAEDAEVMTHRGAHAEETGGRVTAGAPGAHGRSSADCVSTQARDRSSLTGPPAAAAPWTHPQPPAVAGPLRSCGAQSGRSPPDGGRELLTLVCVTRR
ncbi:hypothetical protein KCH_40600 [Kitasatospora cheerisanensis KCTC 2395]|uniref:Secreted protein n=1 Tax=Kitasatospora cheerisanensis KCTC 2395 TaxID=1348663 RepID=A0A066YWC3_9ACTN|nr:hypothetical protein KCH_40600 [Kitasatospora cheerisanensis KCTC 2395]